MQGRAGAMSKTIYLTFPIQILKGGLNDIKGCTNNAMFYCLYYQYLREVKNESDNPLNKAADYIGINFSNINKASNTGKSLYESIPKNAPLTSITRDMIFDFYENDKTQFEVVCFLAFAALKSIIQDQGYKKMTNEYLFSRMSGNSKGKADIDPTLKPFFTSRYQLDKIKQELQLNWGLKYYAMKSRGFYVSFTKSLTELAKIAEKNNKAYKLKQLKDMKQQARRRAIEELSKPEAPASNVTGIQHDVSNISAQTSATHQHL